MIAAVPYRLNVRTGHPLGSLSRDGLPVQRMGAFPGYCWSCRGYDSRDRRDGVCPTCGQCTCLECGLSSQKR